MDSIGPFISLYKVSPSIVSLIPFDVLMINVLPKLYSSFFICLLTAGWETYRISATFVRFLNSQT